MALATIPASTRAVGGLDPGFGGRGTILTSIGADGVANADAVVPAGGGRALAGGFARTDSVDSFALARYREDGRLDPGFGSGGAVLTRFGQSTFAGIRAMAPEPDGGLVAAGFAADSGRSDLALARYRPGGALDGRFGSNGRVVTAVGNNGFAAVEGLVRQPDGRMVVAGTAAHRGARQFVIARYNANGSLDPTFARQYGLLHRPPGSELTELGDRGFAGANALAIQPDGKLVAAGFARVGERIEFAVVRYHSDGARDRSFGSNGAVLTPVGSGGNARAAAVAVQPDGKLVVAGFAVDGTARKFALVRYRPEGGLDRGFGSGGVVLTTVGSGAQAEASALVRHPGGGLIACGQAEEGGVRRFALVRYTRDGRRDRAFGRQGAILTPIGSDGRATCDAVAFDRRGRLVAAGHAEDQLVEKFALARYDVEPPELGIRLRPGSLRGLVRGRPLRVSVRASEPASLRLVATVGRHGPVAAKRVVRMRRAGRRRVRMRIRRGPRRGLRTRRRARIVLSAEARDRAGHPRTRVIARTFRR